MRNLVSLLLDTQLVSTLQDFLARPARSCFDVLIRDKAKELMYELAEYLSRRYPDVYSVNRYPASEKEAENGWYGEGRIKNITVIPCKATYDLDKENP